MKSIASIVLSLSCVLLFLSSSTNADETVQWELDFESAKSSAKASNRIVMMSFQGSDWCASCKRLEKTLFENEEFQSYADENLVLLKVDFPMRKQNKLSDEQTTHNDALAEEFNKEGKFPRVIFFNGEGELLGELKTPQADVATYLKSIKAITE